MMACPAPSATLLLCCLAAAVGLNSPGERAGRLRRLGLWPLLGSFIHHGAVGRSHIPGPYLPDLSGALVSFWVLFLFVKVWHPRRSVDTAARRCHHSRQSSNH